MKNEEFFEELKGILSDYTSRSKVLSINNNIDQLVAYWHAGAILQEVYEDKSCNYDDWYYNYATILEEYYNYDVGEMELMRRLYVNFTNILNLSVDVSWEHLKLILQLETQKEIDFYLSKVEEDNLSVSGLEDMIKNDRYLENKKQSIEELFTSDWLFNFNGKKKYKYLEFRKMIIQNIKLVFLDFVKGFAFIGDNIPIKIEDKGGTIDILFYNYLLHAFVVVKIVQNGFNFKDVLKISSEMSFVSDRLKQKRDNETKGIIVNVENSKCEINYILE